MCVFSTASALFMFPAMYLYYQRALDMYGFEKNDGIGLAYELVIQGFIRFASFAFFPVIAAVTVIYLLVSCPLSLSLSHAHTHTHTHTHTYTHTHILTITINHTHIHTNSTIPLYIHCSW